MCSGPRCCRRTATSIDVATQLRLIPHCVCPHPSCASVRAQTNEPMWWCDGPLARCLRQHGRRCARRSERRGSTTLLSSPAKTALPPHPGPRCCSKSPDSMQTCLRCRRVLQPWQPYSALSARTHSLSLRPNTPSPPHLGNSARNALLSALRLKALSFQKALSFRSHPSRRSRASQLTSEAQQALSFPLSFRSHSPSHSPSAPNPQGGRGFRGGLPKPAFTDGVRGRLQAAHR